MKKKRRCKRRREEDSWSHGYPVNGVVERQRVDETSFVGNPEYRHGILHKVEYHPHLQQNRGSNLCIRSNPQRVLLDSDPVLRYRRRHGEIKSTVHWGQRKLMLSEVEFLSMFTQTAKDGIITTLCIYAGSAPGNHISYLSKLFPMVQFILIDPSDFAIEESDRIQIRQEYMTTEIANELSSAGKDNDKEILFISDIRSIDYRMTTLEGVEDGVKRDMQWQMDWHNIIQPKAGMYKFRLPWDNSTTEYLDGDIYLPVWGPQSTTECRLIVRHSDRININEQTMKMYSNEKICNQLFYFNTITRCQIYDHSIVVSDMDHCYDCACELAILSKYLHSFHTCGETLPSCNDQHYVDSSFDSHSSNLRFLSHQISVCCSSKHNVRSLLQKKSIHSFRKKYFDIENKQIILQDDDVIDPSTDTAHPQNDKVLSTLSKNIANALNSISLTQDQCDGENPRRTIQWMEIPEFVWDDVEDSSMMSPYDPSFNMALASKPGLLCGSSVPMGCAADIWIWGILSDMCMMNECNYPRPHDISCIHPPHISYEHKHMILQSFFTFDALFQNETYESIPAILMIFESGCAYIVAYPLYSYETRYIPDVIKVCLPTCRYNHSVSVFEIEIKLLSQSNDMKEKYTGKKELVFRDIISWKGKYIRQNDHILSRIQRNTILKEFLDQDFNFDDNPMFLGRQDILNMAGFETISVVSV